MSTTNQNQMTEEDNSTEAMQDRNAIKLWQSRITSAKRKFEPDFKRMRKNMEFATGLQWTGQAEMDDERYIANLVLQLVNHKVAILYAKDPKAIAKRRKQRDFSVWDGEVESLMQSMQGAMQAHAGGGTAPPETMMLLNDFMAGKQKQQLVEHVCETLEIVYQYFVDAQRPDFKEQMKQMLRRAVICGVGYVRPVFCRDDYEYGQPSSIDAKSELTDRMARVKALVNNLNDGNTDPQSASFATLRSLIMSVGASQTLQDSFSLPERLEFDFPPATAIIVDERCRNLKDFVAARWIAQEYILPVEEVNAIFGVDIKSGSGEGYAKEYTTQGDVIRPSMPRDQTDNDPLTKRLIGVFEVFDYTTKTKFYLADGWKDYVAKPEPVEPAVSGFWPIFALVLNDCESEVGTKASIYPPSDVQLVKSAQKEWNRTREALRDHRNANAPKYIIRKGLLTDEDKQKLRMAAPNEVIELEGVPPEQNIKDFIIPMQFEPIDPRLYDTDPLEMDILKAGGAQQADLGAAQPNVTATVGSIAEQSRMNISASNVDDLDAVLTRVARAGGEMLFQELSEPIAKMIAGDGAVWPSSPETRQKFLMEILLTIEAASSGRPNKAIDVQNFVQLSPLLMQAGANPIGIVEEGVRRLDDTLDVSKFYPLLPTAPVGAEGGQAPPSSPQGGENPSEPQPLSNNNQLTSGAPGGMNTGAEAPPGPMEAATA